MKRPLPSVPTRWYHGLTGYHWLVLIVASLGWLCFLFGLLVLRFAPETRGKLLPEG